LSSCLVCGRMCRLDGIVLLLLVSCLRVFLDVASVAARVAAVALANVLGGVEIADARATAVAFANVLFRDVVAVSGASAVPAVVVFDVLIIDIRIRLLRQSGVVSEVVAVGMVGDVVLVLVVLFVSLLSSLAPASLLVALLWSSSLVWLGSLVLAGVA